MNPRIIRKANSILAVVLLIVATLCIKAHVRAYTRPDGQPTLPVLYSGCEDVIDMLSTCPTGTRTAWYSPYGICKNHVNNSSENWCCEYTAWDRLCWPIPGGAPTHAGFLAFFESEIEELDCSGRGPGSVCGE